MKKGSGASRTLFQLCWPPPPTATSCGDGQTRMESAVDGFLQTLAGCELRHVACSDINFSAGRRIAALAGCTMRNGEAAETGEANVAAVLQFALDGFENSVDSRCCVGLGDASFFGNCGHEFILVHVSIPLFW